MPASRIKEATTEKREPSLKEVAMSCDSSAQSARNLIGCTAAVLLAIALPFTASAQAKKPNILFIMGDDIGWYNTSIYNRAVTWGIKRRTSIASVERVGCFLVGTLSRAVLLVGRPLSTAGLRSFNLDNVIRKLGPKD